MNDPFQPWLNPSGAMTQQGAQNMGTYQANNGGYSTPQGQHEQAVSFQQRQNAFEAEQRRIAELRRMQGGF